MKLFKITFVLFFSLLSLVNAQTNLNRYQYAKIETNFGVMFFKLSNETPKHKANFIRLAKLGYFDTYDFNRVLKGFVAQGGETDSAYATMEKAGQKLERIPAEFSPNLFHQKGALGMGRDDNQEKASFLGQIYIVDGKKYTDSALTIVEKRIGNGFQFTPAQRKAYQEVGGVAHLDQHYVIFGQLVKGFEVLELIMDQTVNKAGKPTMRIGMKVSILLPKEIAALKL